LAGDGKGAQPVPRQPDDEVLRGAGAGPRRLFNESGAGDGGGEALYTKDGKRGREGIGWRKIYIGNSMKTTITVVDKNTILQRWCDDFVIKM